MKFLIVFSFVLCVVIAMVSSEMSEEAREEERLQKLKNCSRRPGLNRDNYHSACIGMHELTESELPIFKEFNLCIWEVAGMVTNSAGSNPPFTINPEAIANIVEPGMFERTIPTLVKCTTSSMRQSALDTAWAINECCNKEKPKIFIAHCLYLESVIW